MNRSSVRFRQAARQHREAPYLGILAGVGGLSMLALKVKGADQGALRFLRSLEPIPSVASRAIFDAT